MLQKIKRIVKKFVPDTDLDEAKNGNGELTHQQLLDQVFEHFQSRFKEETTDEGMLYPTSFNIVLHPHDYAKRQEGFAHSSKYSAQKFHKFLKEKLVQFPDHIPHVKYWMFQFSSCEENDNVEADTNQCIQPGVAIIMSSLYSTDFSADNIKSGVNIRATIKAKGSLTMESYNMNQAALPGMIAMNKDKFRINFDKEFGAAKDPVSADIPDVEEKAFAVLKFKEELRDVSFFMIDSQIEISGNKDARTGTKFLKLKSDDVMNGHVMIKFENNAFKIAAFGEVKLNSRSLELSQGGDIKWYDLSKKSSLLINDSVIIDFKAIKKQIISYETDNFFFRQNRFG